MLDMANTRGSLRATRTWSPRFLRFNQEKMFVAAPETLDPVIPVRSILHGHPLVGPLWTRTLQEDLLEWRWGKCQVRSGHVSTFVKTCSCASLSVPMNQDGWQVKRFVGENVVEL